MPLYIDCNTGLVESQEFFELSDGGRDWKKRKKMSINVAHLMSKYDPERAKLIRQCGTYLGFARTPDGQMTLQTANFCRQRLCPMCQWRRSIKIRLQADKMYSVLAAQGYRAVFVSLTVRNCTADKLIETVDHLYESAKVLQHLPTFRRSFVGLYRAFEVTYNAEAHTYHPHLHYLLIVKPEYFDRSSGLYWEHKDLVKRWRRSAKLDYDPDVSIEAIKADKSGNLTKAMAEATKYPTKVAEIQDAHVLETIDYALRGRRLIAWGGVCAQVRRQLQLDDAEDGDLVHADQTTIADDVPVEQVVYIWRHGLYLPMDVKPIEVLIL